MTIRSSFVRFPSFIHATALLWILFVVSNADSESCDAAAERDLSSLEMRVNELERTIEDLKKGIPLSKPLTLDESTLGASAPFHASADVVSRHVLDTTTRGPLLREARLSKDRRTSATQTMHHVLHVARDGVLALFDHAGDAVSSLALPLERSDFVVTSAEISYSRSKRATPQEVLILTNEFSLYVISFSWAFGDALVNGVSSSSPTYSGGSTRLKGRSHVEVTVQMSLDRSNVALKSAFRASEANGAKTDVYVAPSASGLGGRFLVTDTGGRVVQIRLDTLNVASATERDAFVGFERTVEAVACERLVTPRFGSSPMCALATSESIAFLQMETARLASVRCPVPVDAQVAAIAWTVHDRFFALTSRGDLLAYDKRYRRYEDAESHRTGKSRKPRAGCDVVAKVRVARGVSLEDDFPSLAYVASHDLVVVHAGGTVHLIYATTMEIVAQDERNALVLTKSVFSDVFEMSNVDENDATRLYELLLPRRRARRSRSSSSPSSSSLLKRILQSFASNSGHSVGNHVGDDDESERGTDLSFSYRSPVFMVAMVLIVAHQFRKRLSSAANQQGLYAEVAHSSEDVSSLDFEPDELRELLASTRSAPFARSKRGNASNGAQRKAYVKSILKRKVIATTATGVDDSDDLGKEKESILETLERNPHLDARDDFESTPLPKAFSS